MRGKVSDHIRRNTYGLIAVFIALGGTGYAATHLRETRSSRSRSRTAR